MTPEASHHRRRIGGLLAAGLLPWDYIPGWTAPGKDEEMSGRGRGPVKAVSVKVPERTYDVIRDYAVEHGMDVTSVINWMIAEQLPAIARQREPQPETQMLSGG